MATMVPMATIGSNNDTGSYGDTGNNNSNVDSGKIGVNGHDHDL